MMCGNQQKITPINVSEHHRTERESLMKDLDTRHRAMLGIVDTIDAFKVKDVPRNELENYPIGQFIKINERYVGKGRKTFSIPSWFL